MAEEKLHWTQRPENKERLSKIRRKAIKARVKKAKEVFPDEELSSGTTVQEVQVQTASGYALGKIDQIISDTAGQIGVPYQSIAERVWPLLRDKAGRRISRSEMQVPHKKLRGDTSS